MTEAASPEDWDKAVREVQDRLVREIESRGAAQDLPMDVTALLAGYVAVKTVGPFLEAFSKKLGERLGESAAEALKRIRVRRHIDIDTPGATTPTTLKLPDDFTDEAKIAAIELDLTAADICGATLCWNPDTHTWEREQPTA